MKSEVLFIGHGSPMNILKDNTYTRSWRELGNKIVRPKAILAISAHWYTDKTAMTQKNDHKQIYDMYGFPNEIYEVEYHAKSDKVLEGKVRAVLGNCVEIDDSWGLDHGLWSVLRFMYPDADVPVCILSIDASKSSQEHFAIAQKLKSLREEGYLILTSGNIVHNLRTVDWNDQGMRAECEDFDTMVHDKILGAEYEDLVDYRNLENVEAAFPTPDHYLPLVYALGFLTDNEEVEVFNRGGELGSISMTSYIFR